MPQLFSSNIPTIEAKHSGLSNGAVYTKSTRTHDTHLQRPPIQKTTKGTAFPFLSLAHTMY